MKSILLTTTALVAFAGAAAADGHAGVSFSGSATLGYNDADWADAVDPTGDGNDGFYGDLELDVSMVAALDNGVTVTATADIGDLDAADAKMGGVTIEIASEMASLTFGDTNSSADTHWSGVDGASVADFNGETEHAAVGFDAIIRGEATFGDVTGSVSYGVEMQDGDESLGALQVAAVADLGGFTVVGAYQAEDEDYGIIDQTGVSVAGAVAGIDVMASYLTNDNDTSIGVSASAPFGPVTIGGYYSSNENSDNAYGLDLSYVDGPLSVSADIDTTDADGAEASWEVDANYEVMDGAVLHAGFNSGEEYYVAGTYDLGGGASLLVSYAEGNLDDDEIGEDDIQEGATVEVSFSF